MSNLPTFGRRPVQDRSSQGSDVFRHTCPWPSFSITPQYPVHTNQSKARMATPESAHPSVMKDEERDRVSPQIEGCQLTVLATMNTLGHFIQTTRVATISIALASCSGLQLPLLATRPLPDSESAAACFPCLHHLHHPCASCAWI